MKLDDIVSILKTKQRFKESKAFENISKKDIKGIIEDAFFYIREAALSKGDEVSIAGFGKFVKFTREGISAGAFGKGKKYKSTKLGFKPFAASKIKG